MPQDDSDVNIDELTKSMLLITKLLLMPKKLQDAKLAAEAKAF